MVGGGVIGKVVGIAPSIMTGVGVIMIVSQVSILMWTHIGEDTTETMTGMGTGGTMTEFPTTDCNRTGIAGTTIDIGKGKELGASMTIDLDHYHRDRN